MTPLLEINAGDTAWVLTSAALVLFMTPMLAFFYGGMVRAKGVLNMLMMNVVAMGTIGVLWVLCGYSMAFGDPQLGGLIGNPGQFFGLHGVLGTETGTIPTLVFVAFQSAFAIIATALVSGAVADRMKFSAWVVFTIAWGLLVYFPAANWVFGTGWILNTMHAVDFAGGTAIHINAGAAALALALVLGRRVGFGSKPMRPHNTTLVMLGAGGLWFGWFGFNAGSALGANDTAGLAWVNTVAAACAAMLSWILVERIRDGQPTTLGAASGIVAGLVGITPACASVSPWGALIIGVVCGSVCAMAVGLKYRFGYDDSLDVVGVHLVGGLLGTVLIGLLGDPHAMAEGASDALAANGAGLFLGGNGKLLGVQVVCALAVLAYSFIVSGLIALVIRATMGIRITAVDELRGIDLVEHAESGYDFSSVRYSSLVLPRTPLHHDEHPTTPSSPTPVGSSHSDAATDESASKQGVSA